MKYKENDNFSGPLLSCYYNPLYHPACIECTDRYECYGEEEYLLFRKKALVMSELMDNPDLLDPENAGIIAEALNIPDSLDRIRRVLTGAYCRDGKIWSIVKISLGKPV